MMRAVLLVSHGSRSISIHREIIDLIGRLKKRLAGTIVEYAFLEIKHPRISEGIDQCVRQGANDITILLNFLNSGRHVDIDIPRIIHEAQRKYPKLKISLTPPIGQHPRIDELFVDRVHDIIQRNRQKS